ncbi:MAG: ECF transporter S component [Ruminococcaceae bacterium]|nr:ECF transporter S component [Oscillospiraceae bacterium]
MKETTKKLTLSAMFIAIGILLPFLTGQIPQVGSMMLPMHIPVFLCGLICGWQYGAAVGFILPLLRSVICAAPAMFPMAVSMALELMTYGLVAGLLYGISRHQCIIALYRSMIAAMLGGRVIFGLAMLIFTGIQGNGYTWSAYFASVFLQAIPGIIIQLTLIPAIMLALHKTGLVTFKRHSSGVKNES